MRRGYASLHPCLWSGAPGSVVVVCTGVTLRFTPAYGLTPLRGWVIGVARPYGAIFAGAKIQLFLR